MAEASDVLRGHIDMIVLARLARGDCYGYRINRDIQGKTGEGYELKEATLYSTFRRLEKEGYIASYWGDRDSGARRRYYGITAEGKEQYGRLRGEWLLVKKMVDALVGAPRTGEKAGAVSEAPPVTKRAAKPKTAAVSRTKSTPKNKEGKQ